MYVCMWINIGELWNCATRQSTAGVHQDTAICIAGREGVEVVSLYTFPQFSNIPHTPIPQQW